MGIKRKLTKAVEKDLQIYDAFQDYIQEKKALNKSAATIESAENSYRKWENYLEENDFSMNVNDIDEGYVYSFTNHYLSMGLKPTSLNHYLRDIRAFLYWMMEKSILTKQFKIKLVVEQEVIKETYTDEELEILLAKPKRNASFVEWRMQFIGLRQIQHS